VIITLGQTGWWVGYDLAVAVSWRRLAGDESIKISTTATDRAGGRLAHWRRATS